MAQRSGRLGSVGGPLTFPSPGEREPYCLVPSCGADADPDAPVALCGQHLRRVHEYTQAFVATRLDEMQAKAAVVRESAPTRVPVVLPDRGGEPGWVYLIRLGDRVKIGYSANVYGRLRDLPFEQILALIPGSFATEHALHRRFEHLRIAGEWFLIAPDLMEFVHDVGAA